MTSSKRTLPLILGLVMTLSAGCGYRLGSSLPPGIKSIHIPTFINKTSEPLVEVTATQETIKDFQIDGGLRIESRANADCILEVIITGYNLEPVRYEDDSPRTADEYQVNIEADVLVTVTRTKQVLINHVLVVGDTTVDPSGDMTSAKRSAMPAACKDLAHKIVETVVEYW